MVAKLYYYFNFVYVFYALFISFIIVIFALDVWLHSPPVSMDLNYGYSPSPSAKDKLLSLLYIITDVFYWRSNLKVPFLIKNDGGLKNIQIWCAILGIHVLTIILFYEFIPLSMNLKFINSAGVFFLIVCYFPVIPALLCLWGLLDCTKKRFLKSAAK